MLGPEMVALVKDSEGIRPQDRFRNLPLDNCLNHTNRAIKVRRIHLRLVSLESANPNSRN